MRITGMITISASIRRSRRYAPAHFDTGRPLPHNSAFFSPGSPTMSTRRPCLPEIAAAVGGVALAERAAAAGDAATIEAVPHDIAQLPLIQQMTEVLPAADLLFGGAMLIVIMFIHATSIRLTTNRLIRRSEAIMARPTRWRADLLMSGMVFVLLSVHLLEMFVWSAALIYSGLVADWRTAGFFAGNTYTTVGYGGDILPTGWRMAAPIIAISGLFTFGWTGSVLVDLVGRCQKIKDAANSRRAGRHHGV
jgi:hypothetical protein